MKLKYYLFFILNICVALSYYFSSYLPIPKQYLSTTLLWWNLAFGFFLALIFLGREFLFQLKLFSIKWFVLGLSLTTFVAYFGNYLYATYIAKPTINIFANTMTIKTIIFVLPILALGEELLSLNITQSLTKIGLNFWFSSFIVSILFALWHINSFGFVPLQLIATIAPIRFALNYIWYESGKSIPVTWAIHYIFNILAFTIYY